jgi:hypothetical protein
MSYEQTADELTARIMALGPRILPLDSPWDLFKIDGFKCDDLGPSLFQADWALRQAQKLLREYQTP